MNQTVTTGTLPETASAAGTTETGRETVAEIGAEIEETTDHGRGTDATSSRTAQCRQINTGENAGETEIEAAGTVAEDEMEIGGRALVGRTKRAIVMVTTETDDVSRQTPSRPGVGGQLVLTHDKKQQQGTTMTAAAPLLPLTPPSRPVPIQKAPHANPIPA